MIELLEREGRGKARNTDTNDTVKVIQGMLTAEGINLASPEGKEITASLLRQATVQAGVARSSDWLRTCLAKDLIDTIEAIGLTIDEHGDIRIPLRWRRPSDAALNRFRLPRLAHRLADMYADHARDRGHLKSRYSAGMMD